MRRLKGTLIEGNSSFLAALDPQRAARELVDDRFVRRSLAQVGGLKAFGFADGFTRQEEIAA